MTISNNYVKAGWDKIKNELDHINEIYSYEDTKKQLVHKDYYKYLFGRAKNRSLIKQNPKLYKSIYHHTDILCESLKNQNSYKGWYNFTYRIKFIVEYDCDISKLKCQCGKKLTWNKYCRYCPEYHKTQLGKPHSSETRRKMRISTLKYLSNSKGQVVPRYNKDSIRIIEEFGEKHGYKFRHAENGGEIFLKDLGYWLDAYDEQNNVVLEIYERRHYQNGMLSQRDAQREIEIKNLLKCKFYTIAI